MRRDHVVLEMMLDPNDPDAWIVEEGDVSNSVFTAREALAFYEELTMPAKDQIQIKPVVFNEFTQFIGLPWDGDDFTPEELTVRAETEKILRAVQKLRRSLDELQEDYRQLGVHVRRDTVSGFFQDYISARLGTFDFGKE